MEQFDKRRIEQYQQHNRNIKELIADKQKMRSTISEAYFVIFWYVGRDGTERSGTRRFVPRLVHLKRVERSVPRDEFWVNFHSTLPPCNDSFYIRGTQNYNILRTESPAPISLCVSSLSLPRMREHLIDHYQSTTTISYTSYMGSYRNGGRGEDQSGTSNGDAGGTPVDKGVDFANYFCTYTFPYHQKEMLFDRVRMDAYYNVIFKNKNGNLLKKLYFKLGEEKEKRYREIWVADLVTRSLFRTEALSLIAKSLIREVPSWFFPTICLKSV